MPLADCGWQPSKGLTGSTLLQVHGPTLNVDIGFDPNFSDGQAEAPKAGATNIPALEDTGASMSCIDDELAKSLGLPLVDRQEIGGVGGKHLMPVYMAQLVVPHLAFLHYGRFFGVSLMAGGQKHQALIGRTFLASFIMIYDGLRGQVTLAR